MAFNNCDPKTNGELDFYNSIKDKINIIFDVGSRSDSEYINFIGEVHYFDPVEEYINKLSKLKSNNIKSIFNKFGLSDNNMILYYYPRYESFYNRINSCHIDDSSNKISLLVKKGKDYMINNNINHIDFLKIDTEGYELNVLKGFEEYISYIDIIQFEYGGTFLDNNTKLIDVFNYLKQYNFNNFSYLTSEGLSLLTDYNDHYQYCNIVCFNNNINIF